MKTKGILSLIIGPVGAGKSTFARDAVARQSAIFLDLDGWMVRLFGQDARPSENVIAWYLERRERVRGLLPVITEVDHPFGLKLTTRDSEIEGPRVPLKVKSLGY